MNNSKALGLSYELKTIFHGCLVHSEANRELQIVPNSVIALDAEGIIRSVTTGESDEGRSLLALKEPQVELIELEEGEFLLPGFVDTHIHAPQLLQNGTALDRPVMDWLQQYTFPTESRIDKDPQGLGRKVYSRLAKRLAENGTTLSCLFGTIGVEANIVLAEELLAAGIRGLVGKVNADLNSPPFYIETSSSSLASTRAFIARTRALCPPSPLALVEPIITPRFVPTCSSELMAGLATLAKQEGVRVQSHASESRDQVEWVKGMWDGKSDLEVFESHGLLTDTTLLAHCTHFDASQLAKIGRTGSSVAHCPLSNVYFSGEQALRLREAWSADVNVGLGSDISGGYRVSHNENMRHAVAASRVRAGTANPTKADPSLAISWKESIYLATLGGAAALGKASLLGSFAVGKAFDAQLISPGSSPSSDMDPDFATLMHGKTTWKDMNEREREDGVERWWCNGGRGDRKAVWCQGKKVWSG